MLHLSQELGVASARIYEAFGSKELFREAIALYEAQGGGSADRSLAVQPTAFRAMERIFTEAIDVYTRKQGRGCVVVSAATNCSDQNESVREWLTGRRRAPTASIVKRIRKAAECGELVEDTNADVLGDLFAA